MAINDIVQTIAEARVDARSLSEFIFKPASFMVARRLAPSVHTLQYYVDRFETIDSSFTQALNTANAAAVTATNNAVGLIDSVTNNAYQQVSSAIDGIAIDANLVTDALITTSIRKPNQVVRTQASKNADIINVKDFGVLGDDSGATVVQWYTVGSTHYRGYTDLAAVQADYPWVISSTDTIDYTGIMAAIKASESLLGGSLAVAPTIYFPVGRYHISQTINLKNVLRLKGESTGMTGAYGTRLVFAKNTNGIVVNRRDTNGIKGTVTSTTAADGAIIEGLHLSQIGYVRYSVPITDYNPSDKTCVGMHYRKLSTGLAVNSTDERLNEKFTATIANRKSSQLLMTPSKPLYTVSIGDTLTGVSSRAVGKVIHIGHSVLGYILDTVSGTFQVGEEVEFGSERFTLVALKSSSGLDVYTLENTSGVLTRLDILSDKNQTGSGITMRARGAIRDCTIVEFPQNGITIHTDGDSAGNANLTEISTVTVSELGRHGISTLGGDSNAGNFTGINAVGCTGYGIHDSSFLGNHYFSCHTSLVGLGSYYSAIYSNFSVFVGCYSEGGGQYPPFTMAEARIGRNSMVIGGDQGMPTSGSYNETPPTNLNGNRLDISAALYATDGLSAGGALAGTYTFASNDRTKAITLASRGNAGADTGSGIEFRMPAGVTGEFKRDNSDTNLGGLLSVGQTPQDNSRLLLDLTNKAIGTSRLSVVNNGNGGSGCVLRAVVVGGTLTSIEIVGHGSGYSGTYTISGKGQYAGINATAYAHNGMIVNTKINTPLTGLVDTALVRALNIDSDSVTAGVDNLTTLGTSDVRYKGIYAVNGYLTNAIGFWNVAPPASKPSVAGLKTPTTLAEQKVVNDSLIAALASYGLISDNRT